MIRYYKKNLPAILLFIVFLIVWECIGALHIAQNSILPRPSLILNTLFQQRSLLWHHAQVTLLEAGVGFGIAIAVSLLLGLVMDNLPTVKNAFYPFIVISQTVPTITLAPLFIIWFGFGWIPKVFVVVLTCFFPILISFLHGLDHADPDMIALLKLMKAKKIDIFWLVKLPNTLPFIFSGLKVSASYAIMGAVIGEWLGAKKGLGEYMRRSMKAFAVEQTFASIVIIAVVSLLLVFCLDWLEKIVMPWEKKQISEEG